MPIANTFLGPEQLDGPETHHPLSVFVWRNCRLVQLQDFLTGADLFDADYVYHSSYAKSWLADCERYAAEMINRYLLSQSAHVIAVVNNDGYLLQYFQARGIDGLGIEPSWSVAEAIGAASLRSSTFLAGRQLKS
jgi:Putative zinc binding domain